MVVKGTILSNKEIARDYFVMDIKASCLGKNACPGQFVAVKVQDNVTDPLLRVPLGIHKIRKDGISLLYKVVGNGTRLLSRRQKGEELDVLGPLGNGFDMPATREKNTKIVIVSGGHGIAPLYALSEMLAKNKNEIDLFMGARKKDHIIYVKELRCLGVKVHIATDDGSLGHKGPVTDLLSEFLKRQASSVKCQERTTKNEQRTTIFACGPKPMLKAVSGMAKEMNVPAQVTYDEYMACGIGACRGCAVDTTEGMKLACEDGPVFDARIIKWDREL